MRPIQRASKAVTLELSRALQPLSRRPPAELRPNSSGDSAAASEASARTLHGRPNEASTALWQGKDAHGLQSASELCPVSPQEVEYPAYEFASGVQIVSRPPDHFVSETRDFPALSGAGGFPARDRLLD